MGKTQIPPPGPLKSCPKANRPSNIFTFTSVQIASRMKRILPTLAVLCSQFFFGCSYDLVRVDFLDLKYSTPGRMVNTDNTNPGWHGSVSMGSNAVKNIK